MCIRDRPGVEGDDEGALLDDVDASPALPRHDGGARATSGAIHPLFGPVSRLADAGCGKRGRGGQEGGGRRLRGEG
eukprot:2346-Rhodomonas_salina.1